MNKDRHGNKLKCQVSELIMETTINMTFYSSSASVYTVYPQFMFIMSCHGRVKVLLWSWVAVGGELGLGTPLVLRLGLEGKQSALATCHHTYTHNAAPPV